VKKQTENLNSLLRDLLSTQRLGVLATHTKNQPYTSLVGFAATNDLKNIVFATPKTTRKYANILADKRVSMLINNSSNKSYDSRKAIAATVLGKTRNLRKSANSKFLKLYLTKHPHLKEFIASPTTAFLAIEVERYHVVQRFQHVMELHLKK
jgi:nitroimidazol reductase NimA-like FMN-containing flavoprotein (pyridoxamine 5'-phosphate oxidase superfamily)